MREVPVLVLHLAVIFRPFLKCAVFADPGWNQSLSDLLNFARIRLVPVQNRGGFNIVFEQIIQNLRHDRNVFALVDFQVDVSQRGGLDFFGAIEFLEVLVSEHGGTFHGQFKINSSAFP